MKRIAVLLSNSVSRDTRVIKTVRTLSKVLTVDLYYLNGSTSDSDIFQGEVGLLSFAPPEGIKNSILRHTLFYRAFAFIADKVIASGKRYDYVYANDLPCLYPGLKIKEASGAELIYDSHEIYVETLNQFFPDGAALHKRWMYRVSLWMMQHLGRRAEQAMVKKTDHFITTCESFKEYFQARLGLQNIHVVMNCPPRQTADEKIDFRSLFHFEREDTIVIFQGMLNKGRALFTMLESFKHMPSSIKLVILGRGPLKNVMYEYVKLHELSGRIKFLSPVPSGDLLNYTRGADIGINLQEPINLSKKLASANKLFEYMHAGIPSVASKVPENERILHRYSTGILVDNEPEAIANAILKLAAMDRKEFKLNCRIAAKELNWENQERVLLGIFDGKR